jgi:hypothetical protein
MIRFPGLTVALLVACFLVAAGPAQAAPTYRGVQVHSLSNEHWPDMARDLDAARDTGANVVRVDVSWNSFEEAGKGTQDTWGSWYRDRVDAFMAAAHSRGLKVVATLWQTPCWAADAPDSAKSGCGADYDRTLVLDPPKNAADYGDIAAYIAKRYRDSLAAIEVWNEPNHPGFFTAANPAKSYTALAKAAYPRIKAVAPSVRVLAGALSTADAGFLKQLYNNGIRGSYDAISVHPYMIDSSVAPDASYPASLAQFSFWQGLKLIRSTQTAARDKTPVWATEFGWNTSSVNIPGAWLNGVSEATQADYLRRALGLLSDRNSGLSFVEGAVIYNLRDNSQSPWDISQNFGLLRNDFSRKPAFAAVQNAFAAR